MKQERNAAVFSYFEYDGNDSRFAKKADDKCFNLITYNDTFYRITTCVDGIGTFIVKTKDLFEQNWSDPIPLPMGGGIDPSLFFDDGGADAAYIAHNSEPEGKSRACMSAGFARRENDPVRFRLNGDGAEAAGPPLRGRKDEREKDISTRKNT